MQRREFLAGGVSLAVTENKLSEAVSLIERATASEDVWSAALFVRQNAFTFSKAFGRARSPETVFLLASITKPMTVTGVMILAGKGALSLSDPVRKFIPEVSGDGREQVTVRHLLTHTSGLPDMLPENTELRKRHAPLKEFVAGACKVPLQFKPGTKVQYQSMGILLAAEIIERVSNQPCREFLRERLFLPLGMKQTSLGLGGRKISETALCQVPRQTDWDWNSLYWRDIGAPWGGGHSTAAEVARFLEMFLNPDGRVLSRETARAMITNQTEGLNEAWGLGWMLRARRFGAACSPRTFGHYGSTGTVAWADPQSGALCVLLTTKPAAQSRDGLLGPVSDIVSRAAA